MLEFIALLLPYQLEMVGIMKQANWKLEENSGLCDMSQVVFAWTSAENKIGICLNNIEKHIAVGGHSPAVSKSMVKNMVNQAVTHEAVHVAQMCNKRSPVLTTRVKLDELTASQKKSVVRSMAYTLNLSSAALEAEAYYMEKSPLLTTYMLKRYCL